jgi:hypothetical protein
LHESIFTNAKNELSSEVTRTPRPVLGTLEAAPSWLAARLRLLALGLALLRPIGLHRACMWKAWRLSYMCKVRRLALRRPLSAPDRAAGCPELRPASANQPRGRRWHPGHTGLGFDTWHGAFGLEEYGVHLLPLLLLQLRLSRHLEFLRRVQRANGEPWQRALTLSDCGRSSCGGWCSLVPVRRAC